MAERTSVRNSLGGRRARAAFALLVCLSLLCVADAPAQRRQGAAKKPRASGRRGVAPGGEPSHPPLASKWAAALDSISAEDMRGHLSFIASDALEGRKTPSRGLDIAAEYIAAQFRRAGLEPAGDDGYFQTANWRLSARDASAFRLSFGGLPAAPNISPEQLGIGFGIAGLSLWEPDGELSLSGARLLKIDYANVPAGLTREQVAGRVVVTEFPAVPRGEQQRALQLLSEENAFLARMQELGSPLVLSFDRRAERARGGRSARVVDPERAAGGRNVPELGLGGTQTAPLVVVYGAEAARFFDSLPAGEATPTLDARIPAPAETPVKVRNVAGVLRGSDPALRDTYVIVSAHYDHIGVREGCDASKEDCVNNGANDDGSGTVGVMELAAALSKLNPRPKRSILFMTFFGEELGLVGSRYYGRHPLVPLAKTVAQVNMEQIGRTDDGEGPQVGTLAVTGFDFSEVGTTLQRAGEAVGVKVYKHPTNSDAYFARSDNQSLADAGVPAHTAGVAFEFPDYHAVGDEWPKVDFANMARVVRAVGLAALLLADDAREPRWNEQNPKTAPYVEAWKKLHATP
ncbi:MAG TPA: M28 family peptidase [Pyrinomonadaceae bacterium]|nr:M28 family peptidase [Pyrinomonadaceae bacterium]